MLEREGRAGNHEAHDEGDKDGSGSRQRSGGAACAAGGRAFALTRWHHRGGVGEARVCAAAAAAAAGRSLGPDCRRRCTHHIGL